MSTILQILAFTLFSFSAPMQATDVESNDDQIKVEKAVIEWADALFIKHEDYKFEHFKAFYTDEYFIQSSRIELYGDKIETLKEKKAAGTYSGTDEQFEADVKKLSDAISKAEEAMEKIDRVTHFQTHFWTNIQTVDGITVYYEIIVKLDNDYNVTEAVENSSIGKKSSETKIAYAKDSGLTKVTEK